MWEGGRDRGKGGRDREKEVEIETGSVGRR